MNVGKISELWRYPVSSLGGERLEVAAVGSAGMRGDRIWGVVDASTGSVASPDNDKRWRPLPQIAARLEGEDPEIGIDGRWMTVGQADASSAASRFLGFPVTFRPHTGHGRSGDTEVPARYQISHLHILTSSSLRHLATLVPSKVKVDARRFRPNVVVDTDSTFEGFTEASWIGRTLRAGSARLLVVEPCARCSFTALAQHDLSFAPSVLHAITRHGGGALGVYARIVSAGEIRAGDEIAFD